MVRKDFQQDVNCALNALHQSKVVLVNTDTVPGMAVDPQLPQAVRDVYHLKGRGWNKPLVWMVADFKILSGMLEVSSHAENLIKKYWPGALTLIFRVSSFLHPFAQILRENNKSDGDSLAVRIPSGDQRLLALLKKINRPLAVTSVNRSGSNELIDWDEIQKEFGKALDYSLYPSQKTFQESHGNKGPDRTSIPSTVVDVRNKAKVIRHGLIMLECGGEDYSSYSP